VSVNIRETTTLLDEAIRRLGIDHALVGWMIMSGMRVIGRIIEQQFQ
jgi:hypothetical protein